MIGLRRRRAIRQAVASAVVGDDPVGAAEVGDLALPLPGMDDRRGWQEEERRLTAAIDVVGEAGTVGRRGVPAGIRQPGPPAVIGPSRSAVARDHGETCSPRAKSRMARSTSTGQRAWGACPPPAIVRRGAWSSRARRSPTVHRLT